MTTSRHGRLAALAGLVLLLSLVLAVGVEAAQAAEVTGTGAGGGSNTVVSTPAAETQGRGGIAPARGVAAAEPGASGTPSSTTWIIAGSTLAVLTLGLAAWALISRGRRRAEPLSVAFCARHPEHAMCGAAG